MIVAARGAPTSVGGPLGITFKTLGATPKGHMSVAPLLMRIATRSFVNNISKLFSPELLGCSSKQEF